MTVLCPYTNLHPDCDAALRAYAPGAQRVWVGGDDFAYGRLLASHWVARYPLVVIEHDIEIHGAVLASFDACGEPWCVSRYDSGEPGAHQDRGLGCVRFSVEAQRAVPFDTVLDQPAPVPGSWRHLDGQVAAALESAGFSAHLHLPAVVHHNGAGRYCCCGRERHR